MRTLFGVFYCCLFALLAISFFKIRLWSWFDVVPAFDMLFVFIGFALIILTHWMKGNPRWPLTFTLSALCVFTMHNGDFTLKSYNHESQFRIMSLNVGQFNNDTSRVQHVINTINEIDPDIVVMQEFGLYYKWPNIDAMSHDFSVQIDRPHYHFQPHEGNIFGTAIFSRFVIEESTLIFNQLSNTNEAWVHNIQCDSQTLRLVNLHLQSFNLTGDRLSAYAVPLVQVSSYQNDQVDAILKEVQGSNVGHTLILGDQNAAAGSDIYTRFAECYIDVVSAFGKGWMTTHAFLPLRIDHVFVSPELVVSEVSVVSNSGSDHKAIVLDISSLPCLHSAVEN